MSLTFHLITHSCICSKCFASSIRKMIQPYWWCSEHVSVWCMSSCSQTLNSWTRSSRTNQVSLSLKLWLFGLVYFIFSVIFSAIIWVLFTDVFIVFDKHIEIKICMSYSFMLWLCLLQSDSYNFALHPCFIPSSLPCSVTCPPTEEVSKSDLCAFPWRQPVSRHCSFTSRIRQWRHLLYRLVCLKR